MNEQQLKDKLINLQLRMEGLQKAEAEAYAAKLEADRKISECSLTWYSIWTEYLKTKERLSTFAIKINKA